MVPWLLVRDSEQNLAAFLKMNGMPSAAVSGLRYDHAAAPWPVALSRPRGRSYDAPATPGLSRAGSSASDQPASSERYHLPPHDWNNCQIPLLALRRHEGLQLPRHLTDGHYSRGSRSLPSELQLKPGFTLCDKWRALNRRQGAAIYAPHLLALGLSAEERDKSTRQGMRMGPLFRPRFFTRFRVTHYRRLDCRRTQQCELCRVHFVVPIHAGSRVEAEEAGMRAHVNTYAHHLGWKSVMTRLHPLRNITNATENLEAAVVSTTYWALLDNLKELAEARREDSSFKVHRKIIRPMIRACYQMMQQGPLHRKSQRRAISSPENDQTFQPSGKRPTGRRKTRREKDTFGVNGPSATGLAQPQTQASVARPGTFEPRMLLAALSLARESGAHDGDALQEAVRRHMMATGIAVGDVAVEPSVARPFSIS